MPLCVDNAFLYATERMCLVAIQNKLHTMAYIVPRVWNMNTGKHTHRSILRALRCATTTSESETNKEANVI